MAPNLKHREVNGDDDDDDCVTYNLHGGLRKEKSYSKSPVSQSNQQALPTNLVEVCKHLPDDIFEIRPFRAYLAAAQAIGMTVASMYLLTYCTQWWALCLGWFFAGTCMTGMFIIGHDCAHGAFSKSSMEASIVGTIMLAPLGWPYQAWLISHNHHHAYTNQLEKDHLWSPLNHEMVAKTSNFLLRILEYFYVGPLFFEGSILHHLVNMNVFTFPKRFRRTVFISISVALVTVGGLWYGLYLTDGWWGVFKYWMVPYLCFNFWLSTYTYFHHKSRDIGWIEKHNWNKAQAQLFHTAHVDYHPIIEWLHFDINWHIPHHVSTRIPWYNLRRATYALLKVYGDRLHTYEMSPTYWADVTSECHVHDDKSKYVSISTSLKRSEKKKV
eukprot:CFRG8212T1